MAKTVKTWPAMQETQNQSTSWEDLWRREGQPIPVVLPGKFHGQRNLVGYSPWGCKVHGRSTEHIINLWKINLVYRMHFIFRKSELKSVF